MLRILSIPQEKHDFHAPELPAKETCYEKDGRGIGDPEIGQRYELDAQSNRGFRTRLSRAFSLRRKPAVDGASTIPGEEIPPMSRAALVLEAIILPELPAQSVRVGRPSIVLIPKRDDGVRRVEAEKIRGERSKSMRVEDEIQKLFSELDEEKGLTDERVETGEVVVGRLS
jgi:hypothetical protein